MPVLPNLLVIGAAKAGTTSLHEYLSLHPEIFMARDKELSFFDGLRSARGLDWYKAQFDAGYPVNGEASPRYTLYPKLPGVPERIKEVLGTPKMIYIIRDPVDRILSNYTQNVDWWPDTSPLMIADANFQQSEYALYSSYFLQLSRYFEVFSREAVHVVIMERLNSDPKSVLRELFRFIGVDESYWSPHFDRRLNAGETKRFIAPWFDRIVPSAIKKQVEQPSWMPWPASTTLRSVSRLGGRRIKKPTLSPEQDVRLQEFLKADVAALRTFLADPIPEWRAYA